MLDDGLYVLCFFGCSRDLTGCMVAIHHESDIFDEHASGEAGKNRYWRWDSSLERRIRRSSDCESQT